MKMRHIAVAASAALLSYGAIAGGGQHQSQTRDDGSAQVRTDAETVRQAQDQLRTAGYPATPQGLREFQQAKGIEPSGKLDEQTLAALGMDATASSGATSGKDRRN